MNQGELAMARNRKNPRQTTMLAELKLRLPESLRADLEHAAARNKRSMNAEMVKRLSESFQETNKTQLIANALVKELDADILAAMIDKILAEGILSARPPRTVTAKSDDIAVISKGLERLLRAVGLQEGKQPSFAAQLEPLSAQHDIEEDHEETTQARTSTSSSEDR
jgi:hypothetical protein